MSDAVSWLYAGNGRALRGFLLIGLTFPAFEFSGFIIYSQIDFKSPFLAAEWASKEGALNQVPIAAD